MYNFTTFPDRRSTYSAKWNFFPDDVLPLWVADMDFLSAPEIITALEQRAKHGIFGYPFPDDDLKQTVVDWVDRQYRWKITPEDLVFLSGVVPGLNVTARAFTEPGDSIAISTPVYGPFLTVHENNRIDMVDIPMRTDSTGKYYHDMDEFNRQIRQDTKVFYLCNPQNPTGKVYTRDELTALADACLENDVLICSDEIHCDLVYAGYDHIPIASLNEAVARNTITFIAPSKTFNLAGIKASVAIIPNEALRKEFQQAMHGFVGFINVFGLTAMQAAYSECDAWLDALLAMLQENRDHTAARINAVPGLSMKEPQGTYLAWIKTELELDDQKPSDFFSKQAKVAMNDGAWFGENGRDYVRLNFACPRPLLDEGLNKIETAVRSLTP